MTTKPQKPSTTTLSIKDTLMIFGVACITIWVVFFLVQTRDVVAQRQLMINYEQHQRPYVRLFYPQYTDFNLGLYATALIVILRLLLTNTIFPQLGDMILPADRWGTGERRERIERFAAVCFKFCYFGVAITWGYLLLRKMPWMPWILGGSGSTAKCWEGFPYQEEHDGVTLYYMVQLGYHIHSFLFLVAMKHRSDFCEMSLHHLCAIFLVCFSYMINYIRIGTLVFFIHDLSDFAAYLAKGVSDTNYNKFIAFVWVSLAVSWVYSRLFVLPVWVIWSTSYESVRIVPDTSLHHGFWFFNCLLLLLLALHIYWFVMIMQMGLKFLLKGKSEDIIEKIEAEKELAQ